MAQKPYIVSDTGADIEAVVKLLDAQPIGLMDLGQRISANSDSHGVVFVPNLAHYLLDGADAHQALEAWMEQAHAILSVLHRNRRSVLLLDALDALEAPDHASAIIKAWMSGTPEPAPLPRHGVSTPFINELAHLAGLAVIAERSEAAILHEELRAAIAPIFELDARSVDGHYARVRERMQQLQADEAVSVEEAARLRELLIFASENYMVAARDAEATEVKVEQLREALGLAVENYAAASADADQRRSSAERAEHARLTAQAELNEHRAHEKKMKTEIERLKSKITTLRKELDAVKDHEGRILEALEATRSSTSWKVTAPIRAVRSALVNTPKGSEPGE